MSAPLAYVQGRFVPQSEARLPIHDAGVVYGATVTEFCRTFRHRLFRLGDHLERFRQGCAAALVPCPWAEADLAAVAAQLVERNAASIAATDDLALIFFATPGPIGYLLGQPGAAGDGEPTLVMHTFPLPWVRYRRFFVEGVALVVPPVRQLPAGCLEPRIKHRSRLHWWRADQWVRRHDPKALALLLDGDGHVTETALANFCIVRGGTVVSPPRDSILDGISLRVTAQLCRQLGIPMSEAPFTLPECLRADEAFLTGTAFCLAGVRWLNGREFSWPGPVTQKLMEAWAGLVGLDYVAQILGG
ncbi:MAG: aminotransferase class IV [Gemmataceae bacterium]|nr:aminotransferase class IV [Gemmataceae bacterium]MDW8263708.1 aminotransferase class IV [Gemmataceae bacterium]